MADRLTGMDVAVFTIGGTAMLGALENCNLSINNQDVDGKGIADRWRNAIVVGSEWEITASVFANELSSALITAATASPPYVTVVYDSGDTTDPVVEGNGAISIQSQGEVNSLTKYSVSIKGKGDPTANAVA